MWLSLHWIQFTLFWNSIAMRFNRINDFLKNFLTYNKKLEMKSSVKRTNGWRNERTKLTIQLIEFDCNSVAIGLQFPISNFQFSFKLKWVKTKVESKKEEKSWARKKCC